MKAYINYPKPHIELHNDSECVEFQKHQKSGQRVVVVTSHNIKDVLSDFINDKYRFASNRELNDIWLDVSLETPKHSESFIYTIHSILSHRYTRLENAPFHFHC